MTKRLKRKISRGGACIVVKSLFVLDPPSFQGSCSARRGLGFVSFFAFLEGGCSSEEESSFFRLVDLDLAFGAAFFVDFASFAGLSSESTSIASSSEPSDDFDLRPCFRGGL